MSYNTNMLAGVPLTIRQGTERGGLYAYGNQRQDLQKPNILFGDESPATRYAATSIVDNAIINPTIFTNETVWNHILSSTKRAFSYVADGLKPSDTDRGVVLGLNQLVGLKESQIPAQALLGGLVEALVTQSMQDVINAKMRQTESTRRPAGQTPIKF